MPSVHVSRSSGASIVCMTSNKESDGRRQGDSGFVRRSVPRRHRSASVVVAAALSLGACSASGVVHRVAPSTLPRVATGTPCFADRISFRSNARNGLVTVDTGPSSALIVWRPGLNAHLCQPTETRLSRREATVLAEAVDRAPAFPTGKISCPADDGSAAEVYFGYPHQRSELAVFTPRGCSMIAAPDRRSRQGTPQAESILRANAPTALKDSF